MKEQIDKFDLGVEFLIVGMDSLQLPHLATLHNPGTIKQHDLEGFWAIGSGMQLAIRSLTTKRYPVCGLPAERLVVDVCYAKFDAETGGGIGPDTTVIVMNSKGMWSEIDARLVKRLKANWYRARRRIPSGELVRDILRNLQNHGLKMQTL
jgi:hypothetical protein